MRGDIQKIINVPLGSPLEPTTSSHLDPHLLQNLPVCIFRLPPPQNQISSLKKKNQITKPTKTQKHALILHVPVQENQAELQAFGGCSYASRAAEAELVVELIPKLRLCRAVLKSTRSNFAGCHRHPHVNITSEVASRELASSPGRHMGPTCPSHPTFLQPKPGVRSSTPRTHEERRVTQDKLGSSKNRA